LLADWVAEARRLSIRPGPVSDLDDVLR